MRRGYREVLDETVRAHVPDDLNLLPGVVARLQRRRFADVLTAQPLLAIAAAFLVLLLLSGVAYAIGRLMGYLPGIGFVQTDSLRVLAEPVSLTREGITLTVELVVADSQRTVVVYRAEGLRIAAANSRGEGGPFGSRHVLRLPDGTTLEVIPDPGYGGTPEPLVPAIQTTGGWPSYASRLVFPPVGADVDELTLVIPILETMPPGAAPENWELTFRLEAAPPNMTFAPITVLEPASPPAGHGPAPTGESGTSGLSNVDTVHGITLRLDSVVELEDGFVLTGTLSWDDSAFPTRDGVISEPVWPILTDAGGQEIPIEDVHLDAAYGEREMPWSFRTNRKIFTGPLVLSVSKIDMLLFPPEESFEFDLGPDPKIGQTWEVQRDLVVGGRTLHLLSLRLAESPDSCWPSVLEFSFESDEPWVSAFVWDVVPEEPCLPGHGGGGGGGGGQSDPHTFRTAVAYGEIPSGLHRFSIRASIPYQATGPWQVVWQPPVVPGATPTSGAEACLTRQAWLEALSRRDELPADLGGRLLVSLDVDGLTPMPVPAPSFPPIQLINLDGTDPRTIVNGGWPALSPDGKTLLYTDQQGFHSLELSTGEDSLLGVDGYAPIWSPDGSRILFASFPGLRVMNADGSRVEDIDVEGAEITPPVGWLPDNKTLVYSVLSGDGFTFVMRNVNGGSPSELFSVQNKWGFGRVSPDGQWVAFLDRVFGAPTYGVFVSRLDGSERRLVGAPDIPMSSPAWSSDGRWLLVMTLDWPEGIPAYRPVLIDLSTCQVIALPDVHGAVEGWVR